MYSSFWPYLHVVAHTQKVAQTQKVYYRETYLQHQSRSLIHKQLTFYCQQNNLHGSAQRHQSWSGLLNMVYRFCLVPQLLWHQDWNPWSTLMMSSLGWWMMYDYEKITMGILSTAALLPLSLLHSYLSTVRLSCSAFSRQGSLMGDTQSEFWHVFFARHISMQILWRRPVLGALFPLGLSH